jgi:hypothetical protein
MNRFSSKLMILMTAAFASVAQAEIPASFACSSKDLKAIDVVSKTYFVAHSAFVISDLTVSSERCIANHASANIRLKNYAAIQTNAYLKKVGSKWEVVVLGSRFDAQAQAEIPQVLRDATEVPASTQA